MECSCDVDVDLSDGDSCDFVKTWFVKARKKHKCTECHSMIWPGTEYEKVYGIWEGDSMVFKTCPNCLSLRKEFFSGGYFLGTILDDFRTFVDEVDGGISEDCISHLTPVARGMVWDIIEKWWSEDDKRLLRLSNIKSEC